MKAQGNPRSLLCTLPAHALWSPGRSLRRCWSCRVRLVPANPGWCSAFAPLVAQYVSRLRQGRSACTQACSFALAPRAAVMNNAIHPKVDAYLAERRQAGCNMQAIGLHLRSFARFAGEPGHRAPLTCVLALAWAQASRLPRPRLATLRHPTGSPHRMSRVSEVPFY